MGLARRLRGKFLDADRRLALHCGHDSEVSDCAGAPAMTSGGGPNLFPDLESQHRTYQRGVLPYQAIKRLAEAGNLIAEDWQNEQFQPASLDLRLGSVAYQVRASFLPGKSDRVLDALTSLQVQQLDLSQGAVLQNGSVYIIPLLESVNLPEKTRAKANPKSSTGRLDVFARLITDYAEQFDSVTWGCKGPLFVEIAPKTFSILVRRGTKLNQLRFLRSVPPHADMTRQALKDSGDLVYGKDGQPIQSTVFSGQWLSVDLKAGGGGDLEAGDAGGLIGWKAIADAPVVDVEKLDHYDPAEFWEPVVQQTNLQLILRPGEFYILGSKERVRVPPAYAAEMVPYDPSWGEVRVHYAGFFDPGFGHETGDLKGTRAILEVRSHELPYALRDGQPLVRLIYERLLTVPTKLYGADASSSYQLQDLGLSKQFRQPKPVSNAASVSAG